MAGVPCADFMESSNVICKKIKFLMFAVVMTINITGLNPVTAVTPAAITVEAAAKPALNKKAATLTAGKTFQLKMRNTRKKAKWTSSNKEVASVSKEGLVKAKKRGMATITAKIGKKKYRCIVKVEKIKVKAVKISGVTPVEEGKRIKLKASVLPFNAENKKIKWSSSDRNVATIDQNGTVTAKKEGSTFITAASMDGSGKSICKNLTVKSAIVCVHETKPQIMYAGRSYKITVQDGKDWTSSNLSVVQVDQSGVVTPKIKGTAQISVISGKKKIIYDVKVLENVTAELIAHRGFVSEAPENTMSAFRLAVKKGYSSIECNLHMTKDNVPVILHDSTINRTSNEKGKISSFTYSQVRELDFGNWKSPEYKGEKIPSLEELLKFCASNKVTPYIELKKNAGFTKEKLRIAYSVAKKTGMQHKAIWFSSDMRLVRYIKEIDPTAKIAYLANTEASVSSSVINDVSMLKTARNQVYIGAAIKKFSEASIQMCREKGIKIFGGFISSKSKLNIIDPYFTAVLAESL